MTDKRISDHEKRRILEFLADGYSLAQVARIMRRSTRSVWEIKQGASSTVRTLTQLNQAEADAPRTWDQLDDLGKRCLESFPLFATTFFCLRTPFWWAMAAEQLVKDVANVEEMFTLLHAPTGSGKTTMLEVLTLWLMSGGGTCDPEQGRALRFLFGSSTLPKAIRSVDRLRRIIEDPRPYFDPRQRRGADIRCFSLRSVQARR